MKNLKKIAAIVTAVAVLSVMGAAFAAEFKTPSEIVSGLTGESVESLNAKRVEGKTYGTIAKENGKLEEFKSQMLEQKKAVLDKRVANGELTKEKADQIYNMLKENMANCDGSGSAGLCSRNSMGFGKRIGMGQNPSGARNFRNGAGFGRSITR